MWIGRMGTMRSETESAATLGTKTAENNVSVWISSSLLGSSSTNEGKRTEKVFKQMVFHAATFLIVILV